MSALKDALYRQCCICAPSVVIRRSLFERLGPFIEDFGADDYEYWFRCLRDGARFYYDPRPLLSWRQHENNLTGRTPWMDECAQHRCAVGTRRTCPIERSRMTCSGAVACSSMKTARARRGKPFVARCDSAPTTSRYPTYARSLAWSQILSLPAGARKRARSGADGRQPWDRQDAWRARCVAAVNPRRSAPSIPRLQRRALYRGVADGSSLPDSSSGGGHRGRRRLNRRDPG